MLNYSAIIRTIINQYKRRKKYIFSFLLLSIIVVSAITSMLTKPAISMTNELFDQFIHLQNVKSTDITDDSSDVIPTIDNNYTDSIFRNYMSQTSTILGEATRFHLFAFSDIAINSRCDGNFATPEVTLYSDFGTKQIASVGGDEVSIITNKINGNITSFDSVLLIPESYQVTMPDGSQPMQNKFSQVRINNEIANFPNGKTSLYHIESDFIDFDVEKSRYITLSKNISDYESKGNVTLDSSDINCSTITVANESDNENNVLNLTASQLTDLQGVLKIMTNGENPLIINVDLSGCNGLYEQNFQTIVVLNGNTLTNDEANVQYGTNVLWNYYDSSSADNSYTGKIKFQNKSGFGCILSPSASIETNQSVDGNMIADSISIGCESHKMMFMIDYDIQNGEPIDFADQIGPSQLLGVVRESTNINVTAQINWSDGNQNHSNVSEYITVQLYKAPKNTDVNNLQPSQEINGGTVQLNINNNWSTFWNDKPISDTEAYYVKPVNLPSGCTVTYQNNGISQSGTIILNATMNSSTTNINVTAQINWSDGNQNHSNGSDSITVQLYKAPKNTDISNLQSSQQVSDGSMQISSNINWQNTWSNRPVGDTEAYYVKCTSLPTGCTVTYQNNGISQSGTIIINATKSSTTNINVTAQINWTDGNQNHTNGSDSITVQLYKAPKNTDINNLQTSQQVSGGSIQISSNNNWQNTWNSMSINDNEAYYIKPTSSPSGCTFSYQNNGISQSGTITLNATKTTSSDKVNITVNKQWVGCESIPNNAIFKLYRSHTLSTESIPGDAKTDANTVRWYESLNNNNQNNWIVKITDLPAFDNGVSWYYYVEEIRVDDVESKLNDYNISYSAYGMCNAENTVTITNTKKSEDSFSLEVQKKWEGATNYDKDVTVKLQRSTDNSSWIDIQNCTLNLSNGWYNKFTSIPKKDSQNVPYYYRVREVNVPSGYSDTYSVQSVNASTVNGSVRIEITNTLKKSSLKIKKLWENIAPQALLKDINDIKVSVYRRVVNSQSMMSLNMSSLDKLRTFDDNITGNVLTLGSRTFSPKQYASHPYEICYNLGAYAGSTITKVEVTFSTDAGIDGCVLGGKIEDYGMEEGQTIPLAGSYTSYKGITCTFEQGITYSDGHFNPWTVYSNSALIITSTSSATPSYSIESVKITFGTLSYNPEVTTTSTTTTTTPAVTTTITSTTTAPFTTTITSTTTAPFTTTTTATTTAQLPVLLQPNNRVIPAECELYTVVALNSSDNWQKTLDNLPLGDGKGNIYEYYIVETMINLKDGSTHNYMIKSYSQDDGLQLSENADINLLSITNIPYTAVVTMPSTGGMTTDIYYKTGLLMIITSGGIYISLAIQKKRKTSQD